MKLAEYAKLLLICISLANLALLSMWMHYESDYLEPLPYPELFGSVLVIGFGVFLVAVCLRAYWQARAVQLLALVSFLLFPVDGIGQAVGIWPKSLTKTLGIGSAAVYRLLMVMAVISLLATWLRAPTRVMRTLAGLAVILSPLLLFCGALAVTRSGPATASVLHYADPPPPDVKTSRFGPVFLLVFDEADYDLIFEHRPRELRLPYLDSLAARSAHFTQAFSPGRDTVLSLPALLMGQRLKFIDPRGPLLGATTEAGVKWKDWRESDHLLQPRSSPARRIAVIGFYHPYCGIPGLAYCSHYRVFPYRRWAFELMPAPLAALQNNIVVKRPLELYNPRAVQFFAETHQRMFDDISAELLALPGEYDLVFAHLNMPHPTPVPVAAIRRFGKLTSVDYFHNLQRTDEFLQRFVDDVESKYADANPVVIVTSDHGLRYASWAAIGYDVSEFADRAKRPPTEDFHVPLLIHFPALQKGIRVDEPVNNLHSKALVEAVFAGAVRNEADAVRFLLGRPFVAPAATAQTFRRDQPRR